MAAGTKSETFRLQSLSLWMEIVEPPAVMTTLMESASLDVAAAEEAAAAAKFVEVKARLSADAKSMMEYGLAKSKMSSQAHIRKVMHCKEQLSIGQRQAVVH